MRRGHAQVERFADLEALSRAAADAFIALAHEAVRDRGVCHVALSGGSTPKRLFQLLAAAGPGAVPWEAVELWWGDERTVPGDHADSNYRMAREALIVPLGLGGARVHRLFGEADPDEAAAEYAELLVEELGAPPVFDLALQGLGPDGHTASIFPGSAAATEPLQGGAWVVANRVDSPLTHGAATRLTLTAPAINAARHVWFLVAGADKAHAVATVLAGAHEPALYPAQLIDAADMVWFVDEAAAGQIGHVELPPGGVA